MNLPGRRLHAVLVLGSVLLVLLALIEGNPLIAVGWGVVMVVYFGTWWKRTHTPSSDDSVT